MKVPAPHFLLFSESSRKQRQGQWRFLLQAVDGTEKLEAADAEPEAPGERLELLAVVRGLEALDQPSRVTLVTPSKYVHRGLLYGLEEWRSNGWSWEHFGQMVPVKNRDLWQRLDRALGFHELKFQPWRLDAPLAEGDGGITVAASAAVRIGAAPVEAAAQAESTGDAVKEQARPQVSSSWKMGPSWQNRLAWVRLAARFWRCRIADWLAPVWGWSETTRA